MSYQEGINTIIAALVTAGVGVLVVVIKSVGDMAIKFIQEKIEDEYNKKKSLALDAWNIVDEYFRITPTVTKTVEAAQVKFAEELKKLIPSITDTEIETLRQAIAGEINKGKEKLITSADSAATTEEAAKQ